MCAVCAGDNGRDPLCQRVGVGLAAQVVSIRNALFGAQWPFALSFHCACRARAWQTLPPRRTCQYQWSPIHRQTELDIGTGYCPVLCSVQVSEERASCFTAACSLSCATLGYAAQRPFKTGPTQCAPSAGVTASATALTQTSLAGGHAYRPSLVDDGTTILMCALSALPHPSPRKSGASKQPANDKQQADNRAVWAIASTHRFGLHSTQASFGIDMCPSQNQSPRQKT